MRVSPEPVRCLFTRVLWALIIVMLSACDYGPEPPLRIGTNQWPGYEPFYLARDMGYLKGTGVHLVEMTSATLVQDSLRSGALDAGALTLDETLTLMATGLDMRVVLILDISNGADAVLARPEITSLAELRGRRVGVEDTAVGAVMLDGALQAAGLTIDDVVIVPITVDEHLSAYESRRVDAIVTFEPTRTRLLAQGARKLFDSSQLPGRIVDVLAVRAQAIEPHAAGIRALVRGYFKARDYMRDRPGDAASRMAPRLGIGGDSLIQAYGELILPDLPANHEWLSGPAPLLDDRVRALSSLMIRRGLLHTEAPLRHLASDRFLPPLREK